MAKKDLAKGGSITLSKSVAEENTTDTSKADSLVKAKKHRFTIDLDEEDFRKLRIMAAHYGKSITAYIREVVINGEGK